MSAQYLISTDLDGTLLDHYDYSWHSAETALARCRELGVPVILNTSKTARESLDLHTRLQLSAPLVVENGSALLLERQAMVKSTCRLQDTDFQQINLLGKTALVFGCRREDILVFLQSCRRQEGWNFAGFNDWSVADIARHTGLSLAAAERAADKHFSEPFIWQDSEENFLNFSRLSEEAGFQLVKGGRFYHLQGRTDKAKPLVWIMRNHASLAGCEALSPDAKLVCLGDGDNDTQMLNAADIAVCVRSPVNDFPTLSTNATTIHTRATGPAGWNEAITEILGQNSHG